MIKKGLKVRDGLNNLDVRFMSIYQGKLSLMSLSIFGTIMYKNSRSISEVYYKP